MAFTLPQLPAALSRHTDRTLRWLPALASLVLVVVLARAAADLVWSLVPLPESAAWRPAPAVAGAAPADRGPDIEQIAGASLFGVFQAAERSVDLANAPDTRLNLTLLGILAYADGSGSRALISDGTEEKPYAIGDVVTRGTMLRAIYPDRVILARNGQLETLRLDKNSRAAPPPDSMQPAAPAAQADRIASQSLGQLREQLLQEPARASEYIRIQPQNANGQLRGYRIFPGRDRTLFNEAKLRPGDLVTAVNGIQLDNPANALQLLNDLSQAPSVSLTVERQGQQQTVQLDLD